MLNTRKSLNIGPGEVQPSHSRSRPWRNWIASIALLACLVAFAGCTQRYVIMLSHGNVITSNGKPQYDKATDSYTFTDMSGRKCSVKSGSVREITPASMRDQPTAIPVKQIPSR